MIIVGHYAGAFRRWHDEPETKAWIERERAERERQKAWKEKTKL